MPRMTKICRERVEGYKICGAGGGGCILIFTNFKEKMVNEMLSMKNRILEFSIDINGMQSL